MQWILAVFGSKESLKNNSAEMTNIELYQNAGKQRGDTALLVIKPI